MCEINTSGLSSRSSRDEIACLNVSGTTLAYGMRTFDFLFVSLVEDIVDGRGIAEPGGDTKDPGDSGSGNTRASVPFPLFVYLFSKNVAERFNDIIWSTDRLR